jgi:hypothetical protein
MNVSETTALIYDNGLFCSLAERLARDFKRVLYFSGWERGFSTVNDASVGDGIPNVERCRDIWAAKDEVDLWIFPDVQHSGIQLELESQGCNVWGARAGDELELNRELFLRTLREVGLQLPPLATREFCRGITELRDFLRDRENLYIKISRYRGSLETFHWRSWALDENQLDILAVRFGGVRELIKFLVFDAIDTPLEIGGDTYSIDGRWPSLMLHGIEAKDKGYFGAVTSTEKMPDQIKAVLDAFKPTLEKYRYRNFWSMEVRVKDDEAFFIDPTCRFGLPSSASQMELWSNLGEIILAGAHGELVEPDPTAKFSAEVLLKIRGEKGAWRKCEIPEKLRRWLKFSGHCEVDGLAWFAPDDSNDDACGWLVAIGESPKEVLETIKGYIAELPDGLSADPAPLADVINAIEQGEGQGIEFSKKPLPEPGEVLETT